MKKFLFLTLLLIPAFLFAQNNEGEIIFTEKVKLEIELPPGHEDMAAQLPSEQKSKKVLYFTAEESLFKNYEAKEDDEEVIESESEGVQIRMVMMRPQDNQLYVNIKEAQKIQKEDFFGKQFLIKGDLDKTNWKFTGKQKKVLDFVCQQAVSENEEGKVEVWFTPQIPVSAGPSGYGQLPGMVLQVVVDEGKYSLTADKVNFKSLEEGTIVAPKKGKKVTPEEFEAIQERKMKEMEEEMGGSGMRIRIRN